MKRLCIIIMLIAGCWEFLTAQVFRVGDLYTAPDGSKGIVYYVLPDGSGAWAVALNDASVSCTWGTPVDVPGLANQDVVNQQMLLYDTSGYTNTKILRDYQNNSTYAAGVVNFGNGWCLPSPGQLRILHARMPLVAPAVIAAGGSYMAQDFYWSSAEQNSTAAWQVDFGNHVYHGRFHSASKSSQCHVRAVCHITNGPYYLWSTGDTSASISVNPYQTTDYSVTVTSSDGRTASAEQTITVLRTDSVSVAEAACDSLVWNGETYFRSGTYVQHLDNAVGCDSTVTLLLTVTTHPEVTLSGTDTTCAGDSVTLSVSASNFIVPPVAVGDILCTDNSILSPSDFPASGKTALGVIFYVDNSGQHGWAVDLQDSGPAKWSTLTSPYYDVPDLDNYLKSRVALTDMNGYSNTATLRAAGDATTYPLAYAVDFANGWYVASAGQSRLLYANTNVVNASLQVANGTPITWEWFWTSTEATETTAWRIDDYGTIHHTVKDNASGDGLKFRSIRNF